MSESGSSASAKDSLPVAPLWLHAYSGREHGLMIVGDRASLEALGKALVSGQPSAVGVAPGWPPQVACPTVVGPYKDVRDFCLSFHLKGEEPVEAVLPLRRSGPWFPLLVLVLVCAAIGVVAAAAWIAKHVL